MPAVWTVRARSSKRGMPPERRIDRDRRASAQRDCEGLAASPEIGAPPHPTPRGN